MTPRHPTSSRYAPEGAVPRVAIPSETTGHIVVPSAWAQTGYLPPDLRPHTGWAQLAGWAAIMLTILGVAYKFGNQPTREEFDRTRTDLTGVRLDLVDVKGDVKALRAEQQERHDQQGRIESQQHDLIGKVDQLLGQHRRDKSREP